MANGELGFTGEATPASPQVGGLPGGNESFHRGWKLPAAIQRAGATNSEPPGMA
jgi:hypothetical protein